MSIKFSQRTVILGRLYDVGEIYNFGEPTEGECVKQGAALYWPPGYVPDTKKPAAPPSAPSVK